MADTKELLVPDLGDFSDVEVIEVLVAPGDTVAIVGASGAGKSTLLGLLAGLDSPSEGRVCIDGVDLFTLDEDGRARLRGEKVGSVVR